MNKDLHLRLNTVEELRQRIEVLNQIIIGAAYHSLKEEPHSSLSCLRDAKLWRNGENPYGGRSYPADWDSNAEESDEEPSEKKDNESEPKEESESNEGSHKTSEN